MSEDPGPTPRAPLGLLVQIIRLKASPADLPASPTLFVLVLVLNLLVSIYYLSSVPAEEPYGRFLFSVAFGLLLTWALLRLWRREARFLQTVIALSGTDALLTIALLPLTLLLQQQLAVDPNSAQAQLLSLAWIVVLVWNLVVSGHILRCALELPLLAGVGVALTLFIVQVMMGQLLFGTPTASGG